MIIITADSKRLPIDLTEKSKMAAKMAANMGATAW